MNIKSLITALVLGSSSLAMAQPALLGVNVNGGVTVTAGADLSTHAVNDWPVIRDHRHPFPEPQPLPVVDSCSNIRMEGSGSLYTGPTGMAMPGGWIELAQPTKIGGKREQISVGASRGRFRTIELVANGGDTYVSVVAVQLTNGQLLSFPVDRDLDGSLTINLGNYRGLRISRIVVNGSSGPNARYSVLAA